MSEGLRRRYIAGNWKMFKTVSETEQFIASLLPRISVGDTSEVVLCAPFTALGTLVDSTRGSRVKVAAQNMHEAEEGAFTGEISARMLTEIDVAAVVLGHSERRQYFSETDQAMRQKVAAALANGLEPIVCVGESESEREGGKTEQRLATQLAAALADVPQRQLDNVVVAYEPVWAIGTGKVATPDQAGQTVAFIRAELAKIDADAAQRVRILYGGSVNPQNALELLGQRNIDGALIGGASLDPEGFAQIVSISDSLG